MKTHTNLNIWKWRLVLACFTLAGIALLLPLGIVLLAPDASQAGSKADLIMVFPGMPDRIAAGFQLAQTGCASKLAISGVGVKGLEAQAAQFGRPAGVEFVGSSKSRSTFEDVVNAREIVRQHGVRSVLLVTSNWHVPRSSFLLKCFLLGSGVTVQVVPVDDPRTLTGTKDTQRFRTKLAVNEAVKCWGSTVEMTWSILTGTLLLDVPRCQELSNFIKRRVLFAHAMRKGEEIGVRSLSETHSSLYFTPYS